MFCDYAKICESIENLIISFMGRYPESFRWFYFDSVPKFLHNMKMPNLANYIILSLTKSKVQNKLPLNYRAAMKSIPFINAI